jgi:hypothetical protein
VKTLTFDRLETGALRVAVVGKDPLLIGRADRQKDGGAFQLFAFVARPLFHKKMFYYIFSFLTTSVQFLNLNSVLSWSADKPLLILSLPSSKSRLFVNFHIYLALPFVPNKWCLPK